jgi:hypothetical protein
MKLPLGFMGLRNDKVHRRYSKVRISVNFYPITRRYILVGGTVHGHRHENLKSNKLGKVPLHTA